MASWASDLLDCDRCDRIFVAGAGSHAGKSTVCLGVLAHCVERYGAARVAYIKPATQDERPDAVARWCAAHGVAHVAGERAPIVYYAGFTRAFLDGVAGASADWLDAAEAAVAAIGRGKRVVVVDGVGFAAVGSVCGTSNADVAARLRAAPASDEGPFPNTFAQARRSSSSPRAASAARSTP